MSSQSTLDKPPIHVISNKVGTTEAKIKGRRKSRRHRNLRNLDKRHELIRDDGGDTMADVADTEGEGEDLETGG